MTRAPTLALALAELRMLARSRTATVTAVLVPLVGGLWILRAPSDGSPAGTASGTATVQLLGVAGLAVVTTGTATLVARRQQLVLDRWRTSPALPGAVLAATLAPAAALLVVQVGILFAATARATGEAPGHPPLVGLAVVLAGALAGAVSLATASVTRTVEAANLTVMPAIAALIGGGVWVAATAPGEVTWLQRATGGGALGELVRLAWDGPAAGHGPTAVLAAATPPVLVLLTLTGVAAAGAWRTFRWHARG